MSLVLSETLVLTKTRSQDLKSVLNFNCFRSGIKDVSLVRQMVNVEVIGLSCNEVATLEDFAYCPKLRELILRGNKIQNISEIAHLQGLQNLTNLWLDENPCAENTYNYRKVVLRALPQLTMFDNKPVTQEELREIQELGDEIYEEISPAAAHAEPSSMTSSSGPASAGGVRNQQLLEQQTANYAMEQQSQQPYGNNSNNYSDTHYNTQQTNYAHHQLDHQTSSIVSDAYQPTPNMSQQHNETLNETCTSIQQSMTLNDSILNKSRSSQLQHQNQLRNLSSRGSMNALNGASIGHFQTNNNNILPKGGKSRNGNILSAVLCLVKELDYVSCEVVQTALHCRMEETSQ